MKALTILQPFAHAVAQADGWSHPALGPAKRVENRPRPTGYRGPLLVHAGLGRGLLPDGDGELLAGMAFGAVVALAELVGCLSLPEARRSLRASAQRRHVAGPFCWLLASVRPLARPVPWRGALGLWTPPEGLLAQVRERLD